MLWGFPGGAVVKNPAANAGDTSSSSGPGRSHMPRSNKAHAPQLLSVHSRARTLEPASHNYWVCKPRARAPQQEKPSHTTTKSSPHSPQLEKARTQQQRPKYAAKNK